MSESTVIEVLNFWVPGHPKTKGSLQPRAKRCHCCPACKGYVGKPQLRDSVASHRWRQLVTYQAEQAIKAVYPPARQLLFPIAADVPVGVHLDFFLEVASAIQHGAGDSDKLERNVLDALKDAGVYADDVQVVPLSSNKSIADPLVGPGVRVYVRI